MELLPYIRTLHGHKLICKHQTAILNRFINVSDSYQDEFTDWCAIGCWYENNVKGAWQKASFHRSMDRIKKILDIPIPETSTITMLCILPKIRKATTHPIESIMSIIRHTGLTLQEHKYLTWKDMIIDVFILSRDKPRDKSDLLLLKYKALDLLVKYTVDKESQRMVGDMIFKVVGINKETGFKKLACKLAKTYPELQYSKGDAPAVTLECTDFVTDSGYVVKDSVAVMITEKGKTSQIGWLSANEEDHDGLKILDNSYVTRMIKYDKTKKAKDKIIKEITMHNLGSFTPDSELQFFSKIKITVNVENMG